MRVGTERAVTWVVLSIAGLVVETALIVVLARGATERDAALGHTVAEVAPPGPPSDGSPAEGRR